MVIFFCGYLNVSTRIIWLTISCINIEYVCILRTLLFSLELGVGVVWWWMVVLLHDQ